MRVIAELSDGAAAAAAAAAHWVGTAGIEKRGGGGERDEKKKDLDRREREEEVFEGEEARKEQRGETETMDEVWECGRRVKGNTGRYRNGEWKGN